MKNRVFSLLIAFSLLFFSAACGNEEKANADPKVDTISAEEQYLIDIRKTFPKNDDYTDNQLIDLGKSLCSQLDEGYTFQSILMAGSLENIPQPRMTEMLKISVPAFCPKHTKAMELNLP